MKSIWTEQFIVRSWDVDRNNRLSPASLFNFFQEVAGNHATELGVGKDALLRGNQAWVLSRMTALMYRRPGWQEMITVRTWPRGTEKLFAIRDYDIIDGFGATIAQGRSAWLLVDLEKLRPLRPQVLTEKLPTNTDMPAISDGAGALSARTKLEPAGSRRAAYSDIDYNGHVNNARYIQWIQDMLDERVLEESNHFRLDINYLAEIRPQETISLWLGSADELDQTVNETRLFAPFEVTECWAFEGKHTDSEQSAFRAELRCGA
ncbi:acyl-[acyl-carrier-protein] thioesterase [Gracilinema caldarium]|uniref:acyl-[acyl-carrier-protein] thioesterase n=1 Tax=Gracilinema caldarium TaxID=215591 RepID=UPI0026F32858|nr:acyl-ACP thioesterase domain-containing protein [Gracilinema caldarium]